MPATVHCKVGNRKPKRITKKAVDGEKVEIIQDVGGVKTVIAQGTVKIEGGPPTCQEHAHWDGTKCVCDTGFHDDGTGKCVPDVIHTCPENAHWDGTKCVCNTGYHDESGVCVKDPVGNTLWDSNIDGKWNNGVKRTVTDSEGDIGPNGKGLYTAASGNPKLVVDGDGVAHLVTGSGECEDLSIKLDSRHQEKEPGGGKGPNTFGGWGCSIDRKEIGMKTESWHNFHENSKKVSHGLSIKNNEWHKVRFQCKHGDNIVNFECFIDGVSKMKHSHKNPKPFMVDKALLEKNSYFWLRSNNSDHGRIYVLAIHYSAALELEFKFDGGNSVGLRNVKLIAV